MKRNTLSLQKYKSRTENFGQVSSKNIIKNFVDFLKFSGFFLERICYTVIVCHWGNETIQRNTGEIMNQYENGRNSGAGRSGSRSGSYSGSGRNSSTGRQTRSTTGSAKSSSSSSRNTTARSNSVRSNGGSSRRTSGSSRTSSRSSGYYYNERRPSGARRGGHRGGPDFGKLILGGVILVLAIFFVVFLIKKVTGTKTTTSTEAETEITVPETELEKEVSVDGINITGMSREEAKAAILKDFPWGMKVTWQDQTYEVNDLMSEKLDALLEEIYTGEPKENYTLDTSGLEDAAAKEAETVAGLWNKKAKNGSISEYDASSDKFLFKGAENGLAVDQDQLKADILSALSRKDFSAVISATVNETEPEFSEATAREKYKTIGTFTTNTTSNEKRNTNVKLAAKAINGIVLQPGEEFSFNNRVGERTEAKGYKAAAAYNNGEVVQEIGGGVCQVSSTLYNAVVKAGLKTTMRRSHTFEPSYVTPGTDATVSWGGPDYKFVNNSSAAIGIRASYYNQTCTVSIYGIPVLEDGETHSLKSTKLSETDPPAPAYEEDPTLAPGVEKIKSNGSKGSKWETRLVITKNGEVVSQDVDHSVTYKGHTPVILRNTTGTTVAGASSEASAGSETTVVPSGESSAASPTSESRKTGETTAAEKATTAEKTTAASKTTAAETTVAATTAASQQPVSSPTAAGSNSGSGNAPTAADVGNAPTIAPNPGA